MDVFWWVVGEVYPTWETLMQNFTNEMDEWTDELTNEHTYEWKNENYIPLGINARGIIIFSLLELEMLCKIKNPTNLPTG